MESSSIVERPGVVTGRVARAILLFASAVLLFAGVTKAAAPHEFHSTVRAHGVLDGFMASTVATVVPLCEIAIGAVGLLAAMCFSRIQLPVLAVSGAYLALSIYAIAVALDPPDVPVSCGCLGSKQPVDSWFQVAAVNGAISGILSILILKPQKLKPHKQRGPDPSGPGPT